MSWSWIKKFTGDNPKFWEDYIDSFDSNSKDRKKNIVIHCNTSGININTDEILSIAAIEVENNQIIVKNFIELDFKQTVSIDKNNLESNVIVILLDFIKNATLVGYNMNFTIEMINTILEKSNLGSLKNQYIDVELMHQKLIDFSSDKSINFDDLCDLYKIEKNGRHTTSGDVYITAILFLKMNKKLNI